MRWILAVAAAAFGLAAYAQDVGQIKNAKGTVHVEREGKRIPATAGMPVRSADTLVTGADGAVGVTLLGGAVRPRRLACVCKRKKRASVRQPTVDARAALGWLAVRERMLTEMDVHAQRGAGARDSC